MKDVIIERKIEAEQEDIPFLTQMEHDDGNVVVEY